MPVAHAARHETAQHPAPERGGEGADQVVKVHALINGAHAPRVAPAEARGPPRAERSGRELDGDHVAVGHHVVAPLEPQRRRGRAPPRSRRRRPARPSRSPRRARSPSGCRSGSRRRRARRSARARRCQRLRRLGLAGGEERDQVEQREGAADDALRGRTRRRRAPRASTPASSSSSSDSSASRREEIATAAAPCARGVRRRRPPGPRRRPRRRWRRTAPAWRSAATRLRARVRRVLGHRHRARRPARLQRLDHLRAATPPRRPRPVARRAPRARRARAGARPARGRRRSARSRSCRCRAAGSTRPSGWIDVLVVVRAHDVQRSRRSRGCWRGTGCRGPRPCARRATSPAMSWKSIVSGTMFDDADGLRRPRRGARRHRHDGDVRLDRRERVVRRLGAGARERVEQRGLARVGHPDDADLHHRPAAPQHACRARRRRRRRTGSGRRGRAARAPSPAAAPSSGPRGQQRRERPRRGERRRRVRRRERQAGRRRHQVRQVLDERPRGGRSRA